MLWEPGKLYKVSVIEEGRRVPGDNIARVFFAGGEIMQYLEEHKV